MRVRFVALSLILTVMILLRGVVTLASLGTDGVRIAPCRLQSAEAVLACGGRITLATADLYDLELISGISDARGAAILDARERVLERAGRYSKSMRYLALTEVPGIGVKGALTLSRSLSLEPLSPEPQEIPAEPSR